MSRVFTQPSTSASRIHHRCIGLRSAGDDRAVMISAAPAITAQILMSRSPRISGANPIRQNPAPTMSPNERSCRIAIGLLMASVKLEFLPPIRIIGKRFLLVLVKDAILENQDVHLRSHEAAIGVVGRTNYRLATNVERCVDEHWAA